MAGGPLPGEEALFADIMRAAATRPNVVFHGRLPYSSANTLYSRARIFLNTSDLEGFPNSYLQAWVRGVPVVTMIDPDGTIAREGLGLAVSSPAEINAAVAHLLYDASAWNAASERCRAYMARAYGEETVLPVYLETFERVLRGSKARATTRMPQGAHNA